ncbi:MAG: pilus assembly protein, partial [Gammaproteobacteria bacterium]
DINNTEDLNSNGVLDAGEDVNSNGVLDTGNGTIGAQLWDAGASGKILPAASRKVVTYNPGASAAPRGVDFLWASLTMTQQAALNLNTTIAIPAVTPLNVGQKTLDYIRGDQAQEQTAGPFRKRTVILGDIVNSDPWFVGSENFGYDSLPGTEGSSYVTFRNGSTYQQRRRMLYFGANDGMLHGIDAGSYSSGTFNTGTGAEKLAYVPDAVIPNLKNLTSPSYTHQYFVDGSPKAGDAYINSAWKTVLLGTTGAGGKAVFALDVTAPDSFDSSNVLWEISTTTSPTASDRTTDDTSVAGFQNNLGYTLPQPSLVRMYDGSWAAIVANGYGSTNNKAVLYIINAATGNLIRSIDTQAGSSTPAGSENGLSTPIALDVDNDRITDYIYAGDLKGNLWKFDVTNSNPNQWDVAYRSGS